MKAVIAPTYGGPETLEVRDVDTPTPEADEVLIRVHAASLNAADWHVLRADPFFVRMSFGLRRPKIKGLGADVAGVVEAVGEAVTEYRVGDEVLGELGACGFGACAEYVAAPTKYLTHKPAEITFAQAASLPMAGVTALQALRDQAGVQPGESVLIHGASGGVGSFAIQIAKTLGARVSALGSAGKMAQMSALGADEVIDYTTTDAFAGGRTWDVIIGVNGFRPLSTYRAALNPGGRYLMIGGTGKQMFQGVVLGRLASRGGKSLGSVMAKVSPERLSAVARMAQSGQLKTVIDRTFPLAESADALRHLEEGHSHGKTIVSVVESDSSSTR
ncbi:MAG: NAD(P)-dependent alcohol dehydrogenase [Ornithinimicrobium sp.]